jgi:hypothetical protein
VPNPDAPPCDAPRRFYPPIKPFYFRERFYAPAIEHIKTPGGEIRVYGREKTICDMFRYRRKLGEDLALEALKTYQENPGQIYFPFISNK